MDANHLPNFPVAQESDQPMSVDLLRHLLEDEATSIDELMILLGGLSKSATYRYTEATELRYGQLLSLFRLAKNDRVREAILQALLPTCGYLVIKLPEAMDFNGDGDINDADVLLKTTQAISSAAHVLEGIAGNNKPDSIDEWAELRQQQLGKVIAAATAASAAVDYIQRHAPRPKQVRAKLIPTRLAVRRGA